MTEFDKSKEAGIIGRAKALGVLVLPFLAFAVVVFLFAESLRIHPGVTNKANEPTTIGANDWLSADTASSAGASVDVSQSVEISETTTRGSGKTGGKNPTATTVTTYTVMGKF
jgi:hypothetical protein